MDDKEASITICSAEYPKKRYGKLVHRPCTIRAVICESFKLNDIVNAAHRLEV